MADPTLDPDAATERLRTLAGEGAFERGRRLFESECVVHLEAGARKTVATVRDGELWNVTVRRTRRVFEGSCNCADSDGFDFCAHCVAVALAAQRREQELAELSNKGGDERVSAFLSQQSATQLVEWLLQAAEHDETLKADLALRADLAAGDVSLRKLKSQITKAMPLRDVWKYAQVRRYFAGATAAVDRILSIAGDIPAKDLLALAEHGLDRYCRILERVDDSGGFREGLRFSLLDLYKRALGRQDWPVEDVARHLLRRILNDPLDLFGASSVDAFADALTDDGVEAFYRLAQQLWDTLPALTQGASFDERLPYLHVQSLLQRRAEGEDDVPAQIALLAKTCTDTSDCLKLARLHLQSGDIENASRMLDQAEAWNRFPRSGPQIQSVRVDLLCAQQAWAEAARLQMSLVSEEPSLAGAERLLDIASQADIRRTTRAELESVLKARTERGNPWQRGTAAWVLANVYRHEGDLDNAFTLLVDIVNSEEQLIDAIEWFDAEPQKATELAERAAELLISHKQRSYYKRAVRVLLQTKQYYDAVSAGAFAEGVQRLAARHAAKRSLVAMLEEVASG